MAVSDPWTDHYIQRFQADDRHHNGFDRSSRRQSFQHAWSRRLHMGNRLLGPAILPPVRRHQGCWRNAREVQVAFYGATLAVMPRADKGVKSRSRRACRIKERSNSSASTTCSVLQSPDDANVPAKTFEYLPQAPILSRSDHGIPARLVRNAGLMSRSERGGRTARLQPGSVTAVPLPRRRAQPKVCAEHSNVWRNSSVVVPSGVPVKPRNRGTRGQTAW